MTWFAFLSLLRFYNTWSRMHKKSFGLVLWSTALLLSRLSAGAQGVQHAGKFPGADAGEKISRCIAALPPQGGVCDARELAGSQSSAGGFTVGAPGQPVELLLGPTVLLTRSTIRVQAKSSIVGMPAAMGIGSDQPASVIKAAANTSLPVVIELDGAMSVLQDITVDGNKSATASGSSTTAILVNKANRVEMFRVTAQNAPGYGIEIYSSNRNESCCAKLSKIMAVGNGRAGMHLANTADVMISDSEFENNGGHGIETNNSPTTRIEHCDIGGNALDGIRIYGSADSPLQAHRQMIIANQFGNNGHYDINIEGSDPTGKKQVSTGNLISSNEFIGSPTRPAGYDAIRVSNSGGNTIVGNTFVAPGSHPYKSCIGIYGDREGPDEITANTCATSATGGKTAFTGGAATIFGENLGKASPSPTPSPQPSANPR